MLEKLIIPNTESTRTRYADIIDPQEYVGPATHYVSHNLQAPCESLASRVTLAYYIVIQACENMEPSFFRFTSSYCIHRVFLGIFCCITRCAYIVDSPKNVWAQPPTTSPTTYQHCVGSSLASNPC